MDSFLDTKLLKDVRMHESEEEVRQQIATADNPYKQVVSALEFIRLHYKNKPHLCAELAFDAVEKARVLENKSVIATSLVALAHCKRVLNEYAESLALYQEANALLAEIDDAVSRLDALDGIALIYQAWGQYEQASNAYMEELELAEVYGVKAKVVSALSGLGRIYSKVGDYGKALELYQRSLVLREQSEEQQDILSIYAYMGDMHHRLGKYEEGLEFFTKCLAMCRGENNLSVEAQALQNIGASLTHLEQFEQAEEYSWQAMKIFEELRDRAGKIRCFINLGAIYERLNQLDTAWEYFQQALVLTEEIGNHEMRIPIWFNLGALSVKKQQHNEGIEFFLQSLSLAEKSSARQMQCHAYKSLSETFEEMGQAEEALHYYKLFAELNTDLIGRKKNLTIHEIQHKFHIERLENEKEIYRLRNVELAKALAKVEQLNADLQKMDVEKNDLLGIVAHDLKSPLSNVLMLAQLLRRESESLASEDIYEFSNDIVLTANRMIELIVNLLDVHAVEAGSVKLSSRSFDIVAEFSTVLYMYREQAISKNIELLFESPASAQVFADSSATARILDNLVSNAVKYSPAHTTIRTYIEAVDGVVRCCVSDEGPGLSDDDKQKLFGKFARLSAQPTGGEHSTGLGLSIVKKLVEAMNGRVWCESKLGKGATFWIELPQAHPVQ